MGGAIMASVVFDPPHRRCYPCGQCLCGLMRCLFCMQSSEWDKRRRTLPEEDSPHAEVFELQTKRGDLFHVWRCEPVRCVRRWSEGRPYYMDFDSDEATWGKPKSFGKSPREAKFHIIYSHGRREDVAMFSPRWRLQKIAWHLEAACYMYEWPGYARSTGIPTETAVFQSIEATYRHLVNERGVDPRRIVLYGMSLGTGPTCWLASREPVGGVILHSGFTSICRIASSVCGCGGACPCFVPGCSHCCDMFDNRSRVASIRCPIFVLHSKADEVTPFSHAVEIIRLARKQCFPPYIVDDKSHDAFPVHSDEFVARFKEFFKYLEKDGKVPVAYGRYARRGAEGKSRILELEPRGVDEGGDEKDLGVEGDGEQEPLLSA